MGKTEHHIINTKESAEYVNNLIVVQIRNKEVTTCQVCLRAYVPVNKAVGIIRRKLEEDESLSRRTPVSPYDMITLLERCLKCTHFLHKSTYFIW